ncbi:hypothetical protein ABFX02_07G065800 [Erythranthe guttata]
MDILLFSILIPILMYIFLKLILIITKKSSTPNLPPGPMKLPVIGNLHNIIGSEPPHRALHKLATKFGPVMHLQLGELSTVIISSPNAAKQVMKTHDINFASRPSILATEIMSYNSTSISSSVYGDYWRQLRKICTLELLSAKRVQSFRPIREEAFLDLARWIAKEAEAEAEAAPVNFTRKLYSCSYALTWTTTLGNKTEVKEKLLNIIKQSIELASGFNVVDFYPSVKLLQMVTGLRRRMTKLHRESDKIFDQIIDDHKKINDDHHSRHNKQEDLLDVLLKFQDDDRGQEISLTTDNVKAVLMDMLAGGSETSATTLIWAMVEMLKNPRIMEKAQDEVRRVYDDKGYVDESKIHELEYLRSIIKETLRVHPPAALLNPRICTEKCEINGYEIPAGTKIIANTWAINRDPEYWENADCFEPERFLDSSVDYKGNHFEYIPFGAGRRICPAITFALANMDLPLAIFLYHFDWKLPDGMKHEELDMTERVGAEITRVEDLYVVPVVKRPVPPHVT